MPEVDGLEGLRRIHAELPDIPVVVLTTYENEDSVAQALSAGARGYLLKDTDPVALVAALYSVKRGESLFSSSVTERIATLATNRDSRAASELHLNDREMEVLNLLAHGARNKEIAAELFVTVSTVEKHIASLFGKLEVSNRAEAVRAAVSRGLVSMEDDPARSRRTPT
jgi:DNA-binding NarL/FixJ family response regulator